jgi:hypothetical protein
VLSYGLGLATGKCDWRLTIAEDETVAIPGFLSMFLSVVSALNFCYCWSRPFQYSGKGRVPMLETAYLKNTRSVYPTIVVMALLMEIVVVDVVAVVCRRGLRLLTWSEKSRRREWERVVTREVCGCACDGGDDAGKSRQSSWAEKTRLLKSGVRSALTDVER